MLCRRQIEAIKKAIKMPDSRTQYMKALLQPPKEAEPEQRISTSELLKKRREYRAKREAEIQRKK